MHSLKWSPEAWSEYMDLQEHNKSVLKKANALLKDIQRNGYDATLGKPEMFKHDFTGFASVRVDKKNRITFSVQDDTVIIIQCGGHYSDNSRSNSLRSGNQVECGLHLISRKRDFKWWLRVMPGFNSHLRFA